MVLKLYQAAFLPIDRKEDTRPTILSYVSTSIGEVAQKVTSADWLSDHECVGIQFVQEVNIFGTVADFE